VRKPSSRKTVKDNEGIGQGRRNDEAPTGGGRDWKRGEEGGDGGEEDVEGRRAVALAQGAGGGRSH